MTSNVAKSRRQDNPQINISHIQYAYQIHTKYTTTPLRTQTHTQKQNENI
jgi:hypothetical protein